MYNHSQSASDKTNSHICLRLYTCRPITAMYFWRGSAYERTFSIIFLTYSGLQMENKFVSENLLERSLYLINVEIFILHMIILIWWSMHIHSLCRRIVLLWVYMSPEVLVSNGQGGEGPASNDSIALCQWKPAPCCIEDPATSPSHYNLERKPIQKVNLLCIAHQKPQYSSEQCQILEDSARTFPAAASMSWSGRRLPARGMGPGHHLPPLAPT